MKVDSNKSSLFLIKTYSLTTSINPFLITSKHYYYITLFLTIIMTDFTNLNNLNKLFSLIWHKKIHTNLLLKSKIITREKRFSTNSNTFLFKKNVSITHSTIFFTKNNKNLIIKSSFISNHLVLVQYLNYFNLLNVNFINYFNYINKNNFQKLFISVNANKFFYSKIITVNNTNILNTNNFLI